MPHVHAQCSIKQVLSLFYFLSAASLGSYYKVSSCRDSYFKTVNSTLDNATSPTKDPKSLKKSLTSGSVMSKACND